MRNCSPVVTGLEGTAGRVDNHTLVTMLDIPLGWQLDQPVQVSFLDLGVEPSLVEGVKIMANMHKLGATKHPKVLIALDIGTNEPTHPVIGDTDRGQQFQLAKSLKSGQCKENQLFTDIKGTLSLIGPGKQFRVMEPDIIDSMPLPTMYAKLMRKMSGTHFDILLILETIPRKVVCLLLFVVFVVRRDNVDLLT